MKSKSNPDTGVEVKVNAKTSVGCCRVLPYL